MKIWEKTGRKIKPAVWITAILTSLLLLVFVIVQIDWSLTLKMLGSVSIPLFLLSVCVLVFEGLFTTLRLQVFTPGKQRFADCLQVVAWFVVLLVVLPARLGEVAIIFLIKHYLKQDAGSALISIFMQRLFDLIMLCIIFLLAAIAVSGLSNSSQLIIIASILLCLFILVLCYLSKVLTWLSIILGKLKVNEKVKGKLLNWLNNAISWHIDHVNQNVLFSAFVYTVFKWLCNIGGIVLLFMAINLPLTIADNILLAAAYNFLGVIPLQTVGGFGISEAGLAGLLVLFGLSMTVSVSYSMIARVVIIFNPFVFWLLVMLGIKLNKLAK